MIVLLNPIAFCLGFLWDQAVGDPPKWPHPVIYMGKIIAWYDKRFNQGSPRLRRLKGALLTLILVIGSYILTAGIIGGAKEISAVFGLIIEVLLLGSTLAGKSLLEAGSQVLTPLKEGKLDEARNKLGWFVSRDTAQLSEGEIARGTVETLAENFVDGILSPLFYMLIGGAPLAMAFKAVSTLDSMIAYRNERYEDFGRFAARADDWANYLPARLSVGILSLAGWFYKLPVGYALTIWRRDAKTHPSPNGGNPESMVAGLLEIQLGGNNIYHGKVHHRAEMGDPLHELTWRDIERCQKLVRLGTWISFVLILSGIVFVNSIM
ncbi:adenosylcobinamide-phosphate synthase CbiB [Desulfitobacterium sp. PCE1]|uniref:adenosylcobinamide-phosphate synthase CbiB n=1 Tax=Desulfitobacterium sp. PCE1 TaxID=146907 RepID=UPI00036F4919|nr:adenosylcobinamide-phosphate synthase CbiB [Desulfitobacterium sp. PCE1]